MKKIILIALVGIIAAASGYMCGKAYKESDIHSKFMDVEIYDSLRNRLYDLSMDIVCPCRDYYVENMKDCPEELEYCIFSVVNEKDRNIILTHDAPDLWVLIRAIDDMDKDSLVDAIDADLLCEWDRALTDYLHYSGLY